MIGRSMCNKGEIVKMRVSNSKAKIHVQNRTPFKGSNTFSEYNNGIYIVYSYGYHWPLFIYLNGKWYENIDKYSVTTSIHRSKLHPLCDTIKSTINDMKNLLRKG